MADDTTFLTQGNEKGIPFNHEDVDDDIDPNSEHISQSTRLHHKQRELKKMDNELAAMKNNYKQRIRIVKEREARFLDKQRNTIEYLRKFKVFINETDTKRSRAEKKAHDELEAKALANQRIADITEQLEKAQRERDAKRIEFEEYRAHKEYLDRVRSTTDQYGEVDDLIVRWRILHENHEALEKLAKEKMNEISSYQSRMQALSKKKQNELLVKNSQIARGSKDLEEATNKASAEQTRVRVSEVKTEEKNRIFLEVQTAIKNIHSRTMLYPITKKLNAKMKNRMKAEQDTERQKQSSKKKKQKMRRRNKNNGEDDPNNQANINKRLLQDLCSKLDTITSKLIEMKDVAETVGRRKLNPQMLSKIELYQQKKPNKRYNKGDNNRRRRAHRRRQRDKNQNTNRRSTAAGGGGGTQDDESNSGLVGMTSQSSGYSGNNRLSSGYPDDVSEGGAGGTIGSFLSQNVSLNQSRISESDAGSELSHRSEGTNRNSGTSGVRAYY